MNRDAVITVVVLAAHAALLALAALAANPPASDVIIPAMVIAESAQSAAPAPLPESPPPEPLPKPALRPSPRKPEPVPTPARTEAPSSETAPSAPAAASDAPASTAGASAVTAAPPLPPAPPEIELPSSSAAYLDNPSPEYPRLSRRLDEQGRVVLRVLIGVDGTATQAEIGTSSGFERLDQAALQAVRRWKYLPGKRGGVPEAMWFNVPVQFVLE